MSIKQLEKLFNPGHISVIGNLHKGACKGNTLLKNLLYSDFQGKISAVSKECTIAEPESVKILQSINQIDDSVDIAVFTTPIEEVLNILQTCKDKDKISNVIITEGVQSLSDKHAVTQLLELSKKLNFRILGIHSIGIIIPELNLNASFYSDMPERGNIAFVSQSGAIITSVLDYAKRNNIGFKYIISIGSIIDVDFGDIIDFLWGENNVKSTMLYIEQIKNVRKFLSAARHTSRIKPILAVKSGNNPHSNEIIQKRMLKEVGNYNVYDNAFRRAGIIRVDKIDELLSAADILTKVKIPESDKICIITNSGGAGVLAVDEFHNRKLNLHKINNDLKKNLKNILKESEYCDNPVDVSGSANEKVLIETAEICIKSSDFDTFMIILVINGLYEPSYVIKEIKNKNIYNKRLLFVFLGGNEYYYLKLSKLENINTSVFFNLNEAIDSYYYGVSYRHKLRKLIATPTRFSKTFNFNHNKAEKIIEKYCKEEVTEISFDKSEEILKCYEIPVLPSFEVKNLNHAFFKADKIGYPVNIVVLSNNFQEKEFKKIDSPRMLKKSYHEVIDFKKNINKVLIEKYIENVDIVLQVGIKTDNELGPYIFLGLGGKYKKIMKETSIMLPPLNKFLALRLIERSYLSDFLKNLGLVEKLEELLVKLSYLSSDFSGIRELVIDPLVNYKKDFYALDFKIKVKKNEIEPPYHFVILPYPNNYEFKEKLPDNTEILIRPIKPEDEEMHLDFFYSLSKETNYYRFFSYRKRLTHEQLASFTQIDYNREVAIVAVAKENGKEKIVGVNRLVYYPNSEKYEFAIVVRDQWQAKGVGKILMDKLFRIAKDKGIKEIYGSVLAENSKMLNFAKKLGFEIIDTEGEIVYIRLKL
jgi:acetyltransferase